MPSFVETETLKIAQVTLPREGVTGYITCKLIESVITFGRESNSARKYDMWLYLARLGRIIDVEKDICPPHRFGLMWNKPQKEQDEIYERITDLRADLDDAEKQKANVVDTMISAFNRGCR